MGTSSESLTRLICSLRCKTRKLKISFISFPYYYFCSLIHPSTLFSHSYMSVGWDPPSIINSSTPGEPTTRGTLGPRGRASAYRCWAVLHCWRREGGWVGGQQAGGKQHYLITTAASAKCHAARGDWVRGEGQITPSAQPFFSISPSIACSTVSQTHLQSILPMVIMTTLALSFDVKANKLPYQTTDTCIPGIKASA